jgi:mRNA interferase MazF
MVKDIQRGAIWWADLGVPSGSVPGYRRPVLIVQDDVFNQSKLATVLIVSLTSNLQYQNLPGNVLISREDSGLSRDSVVNITQLTTIDKQWLDEHVADLPPTIMHQIDNGLRLVLDL